MRRHWIAAAKTHPRLVKEIVERPPPRATAVERVVARVRAICLALPGAHETLTWEKPHFRVGERIFAGCGDPRDPLAVGLKLSPRHARKRVRTDPRFKRAAYVGKSGWVTVSLAGRPRWRELRSLIEESYRLVARRDP